jgi:hypothetical protein
VTVAISWGRATIALLRAGRAPGTTSDLTLAQPCSPGSGLDNCRGLKVAYSTFRKSPDSSNSSRSATQSGRLATVGAEPRNPHCLPKSSLTQHHQKLVSHIKDVVVGAVTSCIGPATLPGLELQDGVPAGLRTIVVVPTLLTTRAEVEEQVERLEVHYLASSPDGDLRFALLSLSQIKNGQAFLSGGPLLPRAWHLGFFWARS